MSFHLTSFVKIILIACLLIFRSMFRIFFSIPVCFSIVTKHAFWQRFYLFSIVMFLFLIDIYVFNIFMSKSNIFNRLIKCLFLFSATEKRSGPR